MDAWFTHRTRVRGRSRQARSSYWQPDRQRPAHRAQLTRLRQLDDHSLARERRLLLVRSRERPRVSFDSLERLIRMERLVMKEDEAPGTHRTGEHHGVLDARAAPADLLLVLLL